MQNKAAVWVDVLPNNVHINIFHVNEHDGRNFRKRFLTVPVLAAAVKAGTRLHICPAVKVRQKRQCLIQLWRDHTNLGESNQM